jgi:hypothetical protein
MHRVESVVIVPYNAKPDNLHNSLMHIYCLQMGAEALVLALVAAA